MKQKLFIAFIFICIAGTSCKQKYQEAAPKIAPVTEAVFASGSVEPKDAFMLTALSDGFITKSYVVENDLVHEGQLLFELDNLQQHVQVQQAENNLQYAETNAGKNSPALLQVTAQLTSARAKLVNDSANKARYAQLYKTNSVSRQEYDNAILSYQSSLSAYQALAENYKATDLKVRQDYSNNKFLVENAQAGNKYFQLRANGTYRVYQVFKKTGELIKRGDEVAQLGNPDSIVVNMDLDEGSIDKVRLGQQVLVELNTQKGKTYAAEVSKIYPHFMDKTQSYKVEARFTENVPELIAGTQVQANIITAKKDKALLIPRIYLMEGNKVLVKHGNKADTVAVQTGIISDEWTEILGGISQSDVVLKSK